MIVALFNSNLTHYNISLISFDLSSLSLISFWLLAMIYFMRSCLSRPSSSSPSRCYKLNHRVQFVSNRFTLASISLAFQLDFISFNNSSFFFGFRFVSFRLASSCFNLISLSILHKVKHSTQVKSVFAFFFRPFMSLLLLFCKKNIIDCLFLILSLSVFRSCYFELKRFSLSVMS